jgi:CubicO group peptidase (beta-lactamase class C family)
MRHEVLWDRTSEESCADFERARARRQRLVSICSYGDADSPRHATVWAAGAEGPEQRFEPDVDGARTTTVLARHARDGFHPALIGMTGTREHPVVALVLEGVRPGAPAATFVPPQPFRDEQGRLFVARASGEGTRRAGLLRSIAAVGAPLDAQGAGLVVAGVWTPQPPVRIAWAVHLDALHPMDASWRDRWEPRTLETVALPVMAIPFASSAGARWVLSLWHDRILQPWPIPDPFARAPRFAADEVLGAVALADAVAGRRGREDRRVIALGAGVGPEGTRFMALYGSPGTEATLDRRFVAVAPGDPVPPSIPLDEAARSGLPAAVPDHPVDRWALHHMRETGARHGQLVVVRGRRLAFARAYTHAEAGYPVARLDDAVRLGSVSKALTAVGLLAAIDRRSLDEGVDARVTGPEILGFADGEGPPGLAAVTLRHLLAHDAGLRTFIDLRHDQPENPLCEARLGALLGAEGAPARPGWLSRGLRELRDEEAFARAPGGGHAARLDYSNEGFILLGEILAWITQGSGDAYEAAVERTLLGPAGVETGGRGCLLGAGRTRARARRESPAHPASPTWALKRFAGDDLDEGPLVLAPYADNGPFLGGAAGWSVPLVWLARVLAALGPRSDGSSLWQRRHAQLAATPAAPGSRRGHGVYLGQPGWWTLRRSGGGAPLILRVERIYHPGRLEGGTALLIHQMPADAADDALDATLSIVAAFNVLGPLHEDPHGRELLSLVQKLEGAPGWDAQDLFERLG